MTDRVLKCAIAGLDLWTQAYALAELARRNKRFTIAAFHSKRDDLAWNFQKRFGIGDRADSLGELVNRPDIDFVAIATTLAGNAPAALAALKAGKAVLAGKPLATNMRDARVIAKAAKNKGVLLM